jgi:hypothetical protein
MLLPSSPEVICLFQMYNFFSNPELLNRVNGQFLDLTREELSGIAGAIRGQEGVEWLNGLMDHTLVGNDRIKVDPIGVCSLGLIFITKAQYIRAYLQWFKPHFFYT